MKLYFDFPLLTEIDASVTEKKTVKNKTHVALDKTIFAPRKGLEIKADKGKISDLEVIDVYEEKGTVYHVLDGKLKSADVHLELDSNYRESFSSNYFASILYKLVLEKIFGIKSCEVEITDKEFSIQIPLLDEIKIYIKMLENCMDIVNSTIENAIEVKLIEEDAKFFADIPSLRKIELEYPISLNTSELINTTVSSYKINDDYIEFIVITKSKSTEYLNSKAILVRKANELLATDDKRLIDTISNMTSENESLKEELVDLKSYVYKSYIGKIENTKYSVGDYKVINHFIQDLSVSSLEDFINLVDADIAIISKNNGEYSSIMIKNEIKLFKIDETLASVSEVYPLETKSRGIYTEGRILSMYLERFLDTFDRYLKSKLKFFIENPPIDKQLELGTDIDVETVLIEAKETINEVNK